MEKYLIVIAAFFLMSTMADAKVVRGEVRCGKESLADVIVTDGKNFAQTGKKGKFSLNIAPDADFVYIITPSGYYADHSSGSPAFYQKVEDRDFFTFDLKKASKSDTYNIIAIGDPQPKTQEQLDEFAGKPLDDIINTVSELKGTTVGIVLGDICYDRLHLQEKWKDVIVRAGFPVYTVVGNHDHDMKCTGDVESIKAYRNNLGPENYAFFIGGDLMIVLDNIIYKGKKKYDEGYTDDILRWVKTLISYIPKDVSLYIAQHSPLNSGRRGRMIVNHDRMLDLLRGRKVTFISGHSHWCGNYEYADNIREHNVGAICGTWWDAYHCTDGTPRGYKVYTCKEGDLSWYYKSVDKDRDFQFEIFMPGECRNNPESLVVNVWDFDPAWRVEWWQNDKYKGLMKQVGEYSPLHEAEINATFEKLGQEIPGYKKTKETVHYFAARPSSKAVSVRVKVTDRFGNSWDKTVSFK